MHGFKRKVCGYLRLLIYPRNSCAIATSLKDSRNRVIAHADKETFLQNLTVGAHAKQDMQDFFENLNAYTDAVGNVLGVGALCYKTCAATGDVTDLISLLGDAHCMFAYTSEMSRLA